MISLTNQNVLAVRPFVPAKDFARSYEFYQDLGFTAKRLDKGLGLMELGCYGFLLQEFYVEALAHNFMMQLVVTDLDAWWDHIAGLDLVARYGVHAPRPPAVQPWGLCVAYVVDPAGVLWHVVQAP